MGKKLLASLGVFALLVVLFVAGRNWIAQYVLSSVAESHITGNVPDRKYFDEYMKRDLKAHFCKGLDGCSVRYELLRDGPTQVGISFPKFYLWVQVVKDRAVRSEGAVTVAAIDTLRFAVIHFVSRDEIRSSRASVSSVFPPALLDSIVTRAQQHRP